MLRKEDILFRPVEAGDYVLFQRRDYEHNNIIDIGIVGNFFKEGEQQVMINNVMRLKTDIVFVLNFAGYQKQLKLYTPTYNSLKAKFYEV